MAKEQAEKWRGFWNKYKFVALVAVIGILFLLIPIEKAQPETEDDPATVKTGLSAEEELAATEERMRSILSRIQGVGQLELMLTLDKSASSQYVQDTELRYDGQAKAPENYQRTSETVVLSQNGGGEGLILEESTYPVYRGCLVVCEGGGNAAVKLEVTSAVAALTGLSSDRITVTAWQN